MKVFITAEINNRAVHEFEKIVDLVEVASYGRKYIPLDKDDLIRRLNGFNVLVVGYEKVDKEVFEHCSELELILSIRGGPDQNVDIKEATKRKIPVTFTPGREAIPVAEFTTGLMIDISRNISKTNHLIKSRYLTSKEEEVIKNDVTWGNKLTSPWYTYKGYDLKGKTIGIIGFGFVGKEVSRIIKCFDVNILAFDPYVKSETFKKYGVIESELNELLINSNIVTIHVRENSRSQNLIGLKEFNLMKKKPFLINTSRASIIERKSLYYALKNNLISGAALDVFHFEPIFYKDPLIDFDNVILTPHIAGSSYEVLDRESEMVLSEFKYYVKNRRPLNVFNKEIYDK